MGNEHRRRRLTGEGDAWEICHAPNPKPGKSHEAKQATARRERREGRPECTCAQDPWACCDLHDALETAHLVPVDESEDGW